MQLDHLFACKAILFGEIENQRLIEAILPDTEGEAEKWLELNREYSTGPWPNITRKGESPADADDYKEQPEKFGKYFSKAAGAGS